MHTYKNMTGRDVMIPGIGMAKDGEVIEVPDGFHNAGFEKIGEDVEGAEESFKQE